MSDSLHASDASDSFDPDERALCPDDSCIGVLDSAGRCKVCGRQGTAAPAARAAQISPELSGLPGSAAESDSSPPEPATIAPGPGADADSDDFADRHLCADPACIGVLDPSGRCKECGRVADSAPTAS